MTLGNRPLRDFRYLSNLQSPRLWAVILDPGAYDLWLDPGMTNVAAASEQLKPFDARLMWCYPVSSRVNHVANDDEECRRSMELGEAQRRLFS
jgi:hypothetical protein